MKKRNLIWKLLGNGNKLHCIWNRFIISIFRTLSFPFSFFWIIFCCCRFVTILAFAIILIVRFLGLGICIFHEMMLSRFSNNKIGLSIISVNLHAHAHTFMHLSMFLSFFFVYPNSHCMMHIAIVAICVLVCEYGLHPTWNCFSGLWSNPFLWDYFRIWMFRIISK